MGELPGVGKPFDSAVAHEIDDEKDVPFAYGINLKDANAAHFKLAAQLSRGACVQEGAFPLQHNLVVGDQHDLVANDGGQWEAQAPECKVGLAGTRRSADQSHTAANGDGSRVDALNFSRQVRVLLSPAADGR